MEESREKNVELNEKQRQDVLYVLKNVLINGRSIIIEFEKFFQLYMPCFQNIVESKEKEIEIGKMDPARVMLLIYSLCKNKSIRELIKGQDKDFMKNLEKLFKEYIKENDGVAIVDKIGKDNIPTFFDSDIVFYNKRPNQLDGRISAREKELLRCYCRLLSRNDLTKYIIDIYIRVAMRGFISDNDLPDEKFEKLTKIKITRDYDFEKASLACIHVLFIKMGGINYHEEDKSNLIENISSLRILISEINRIYAENKRKNTEDERTDIEDVRNFNEIYRSLFEFAKRFKDFSEKNNDPLYFVEILALSGAYDEEKESFLNPLQEYLQEESYDDISKGNVINLFKKLYEDNNPELWNMEYVGSLLIKLGIDVDDLKRQLTDKIENQNNGHNRKENKNRNKKQGRKRDFKKDMETYLSKKEKESIEKMSAEAIRNKVDDYLRGSIKLKRLVPLYINRLKELNELDAVTTINLANNGDIDNTDVLNLALNGAIDEETLYEFGNSSEDKEKREKIREVFSKKLDVKKLIEMYRTARNSIINKNHDGDSEFERFARIFMTYKIDKKGEEIRTFLNAFKNQGKRAGNPLSVDEIVYLYQLGIIGYEYALEENEYVSILNRSSGKFGKNVERTRISIIRALIKDGRLKNVDSERLFKDEIEKIYTNNNLLTLENLEATLLNKVLDQGWPEGRKIGFILSINLSDDVNDEILNLYVSNTTQIDKKNAQQNKGTKNEISEPSARSSYIKMGIREKYRNIVSLCEGIPDLTCSIENGTLCATSMFHSIVILDKLYEKNAKGLKPVSNAAYVMSKKFYDENEEKIAFLSHKGEIVYNFSELNKLNRDNHDDSIFIVRHKKQENNPPTKKIKSVRDVLAEKITKISGKEIKFPESREKDID